MASEFPTQRRSSIVAAVNFTSSSKRKKLPVILFDIMDTVVRDPFYQDVPAFFRMPMKELIECKHPTAWIEFEKGLISEVELARKFFKDERHLDLEGLKNCMINGYSYIEGVEELLRDLKHNDYEIHACTNYPIWYQLIEDKLRVSNYLSWTFCSCVMGKRKPDPEFYVEVLRHLQVEPADCIFIDDRLNNVEAASKLGIVGIQFKNAHLLRHELSSLGLHMDEYFAMDLGNLMNCGLNNTHLDFCDGSLWNYSGDNTQLDTSDSIITCSRWYCWENLLARLNIKLAGGWEYGVNYDETFSHVSKLTTVRVLLVLAANKSWKMCQMDMKNAFLHRDLDKEIFMEQPTGFEDKENPTYVCKLMKALDLRS
ncbi:unnamed protein product [Rhodiola kirilowii]